MATGHLTPFGAVVKGAIAGAAGTLAMDLLWYTRYRRGGGETGFIDWELSSSTTSYEKAAAPAQVGKRLVFRVSLGVGLATIRAQGGRGLILRVALRLDPAWRWPG